MAMDAGDILVNIKGDASDLTNAVDQADAKIGNASKSMTASLSGIGTGMTIAGAAITGALGLCVKASMDFGSEMAGVASLGVKDMGAMDEAVKKVSTTFGIELTDAAKATYQAISAGASEMETPRLLEAAARAAIAGQTDLTTAIETGTAVTNAFGLELKNVNVVYDQAFVAVKLGVTTFEELNAGLGNLAPTMAAAGLSSKEMFASVGALTTAGIGTSEAFTGMKAALSNVIKPSESAQKLADALGIQFDTTALKTKGLSGFLADLKTSIEANSAPMLAQKQAYEEELAAIEASGLKTKELTDRKKFLNDELKVLSLVGADTITTMGGLFGSTEALNVVMALTGEQGKMFNTMLDEMNHKTGQTQEAFDIIAKQDPAMAWRILTAQFQVLSVEIGNALLPTLKALMDTIGPLLKGTAEFAANNKTLTSTLVTVVAAVGAFNLTVGPVLVLLSKLLPSIGLLTGAWGLLAKAWGAITLVADAVAVVFGVSVGAVVAAAALLGVAAYMVYTNWEGIVAGLDVIWDAMVMAAEMYFGAVSTVVTTIFETLYGVTTGIWTAIAESAYSIWDGLGQYFSDFGDGLQMVWDYIVSSATGAWDFLADYFNGWMEGIQIIWDGIVSGAQAAWDMIIGIVDGIVAAINYAIQSAAALAGLGGGGGNQGLEGRAVGGGVNAKQPYMVGEKGPELFVPSVSGSITPAHSSPQGGGAVNLTVNLSGATIRSDQDIHKLSTMLADNITRQMRGRGKAFA